MISNLRQLFNINKFIKQLGTFGEQRLKQNTQPPDTPPPGSLEGPFLVFSLLVMITAAAIPAVIYPYYIAGSTKSREPWGLEHGFGKGAKGGGSMWGNTMQTQSEQTEQDSNFHRVLEQQDDDDED
eukprot:TRINITY_DN4177_c0_g1_i2.p2 TRINITY_DN4177_c0_g1~~TRINITY_DN4177_c0_g1_i2.p2  ORF type:complete len:126 (-),score=17.62 TRINITY_DN4177_c0_g1_i2:224-601(-)